MKTIIITLFVLFYLTSNQNNDIIYLFFDSKDKLCKKVNKKGFKNYFFYNDSLINVKKEYLNQKKLLPQGFCEYYHFIKTTESSKTISSEKLNSLLVLSRINLIKKNINLYQKKVFIIEKINNKEYTISKVYFNPCE